VRIKQAAAEFLSQRRVAVTGVSRSPKSHGANVVYRRLKERGYDVFAINPNATGGCPLMFEPTSDRGHRVMRLMLTAAGNVPREVQSAALLSSRSRRP
jgi:hypothetical protein